MMVMISVGIVALHACHSCIGRLAGWLTILLTSMAVGIDSVLQLDTHLLAHFNVTIDGDIHRVNNDSLLGWKKKNSGVVGGGGGDNASSVKYIHREPKPHRVSQSHG